MLGHDIDDAQWGQCMLKPKLGGIGIMDFSSMAPGAYYAGTLACLSVIAKVDSAQSLGLNPALFIATHKPVWTPHISPPCRCV